MKIKLFGILSLISSLSLMGCLDSPLFNHADAAPGGFSQPLDESSCQIHLTKEELCASITWTKNPSEEEKGEFTLRFWKKSEGTENGPYVTPNRDVFVKLWMPDMGHGSSPVTLKPALDAGQIAIPGVFNA